MTISEYIDSKAIQLKELETNFKLVKKVDADAIHTEGCFNCGDSSNQHKYKGEPWTGVRYCWKCKSINLIIFSDRMGGIYTDTILIFQDNKSNAD